MKAKKVRIKVTYKSKEIDEQLDKRIHEIIEHIGGYYYADGYDLITKEREICFDFKIIFT